MPDWQLALSRKVNTSELRENFIHAHAVFLQAMGQIAPALLARKETVWKKHLKKLKKIDWSRNNKDWQNRALAHGRISKARSNVTLTGNYIKQEMGLSLIPSEQEVEEAFTHG